MVEVHWTVLAGFWLTAIAAVIAAGSAVISYLVFRSAVDPCVIVYATPDVRRPTVILLIIENIGKSVAKDVTFELPSPLPAHAFGFLPSPAPAKEMSEGPLISGIPALGPGAKRIITWGQFGGLSKALGTSIVRVTARYYCDQWGPFHRRKHETVSPLEVASFFSPDASITPEKKAADELEKIAKALDNVSIGFRRLHVQVETAPKYPGAEGSEDSEPSGANK